jgi:hypothetical protein
MQPLTGDSDRDCHGGSRNGGERHGGSDLRHSCAPGHRRSSNRPDGDLALRELLRVEAADERRFSTSLLLLLDRPRRGPHSAGVIDGWRRHALAHVGGCPSKGRLVSERAVLAITVELTGELPAIQGFSRQVVDGMKRMGAQEKALEVDVTSSLTKPSTERARPTTPVKPDELAPVTPTPLECAICEEPLAGKNIVTIEGERLACAGCAAKQPAREEAR